MRLLVVLTLLIATIACEYSKPAESTVGQALDLSSLEGNWVLINYWAPWCKPCIEEIPELNKLHHDYAEITVLGVNYDGTTGEALAEQVKKLGVKFPTLEHDPSGSIGTPRPVVLPTTLVLGPDGKMAATLHGPQTVESLLAVTLDSGSEAKTEMKAE